MLEVKHVSDRLKLQTNKRTLVVASVYAPHQGLTNDEKDRLIANINEKDIVIIGGYLNGHVRKEVDGYNGVHGGYGFGVRNTEGERFLEMDTALDMVVCKRESRHITYSSDNTQ